MADAPTPGTELPRAAVAWEGLESTGSRTPLGRMMAAADRATGMREAIGIALIATAVYLFTSSRDATGLDYFNRLADAFLHGRLYLTEAPSWLNELIPKDGVWYVAYPPMPAVMLMPFVAVFGVGFHQQIASCLFGGISVGLAWLVLEQFALDRRIRWLLTIVFGFGTVLWYTAEAGSAWYLGHTVAVMFSMAALVLVLNRRWPFLAGLFLGCATIARLPVGLTAPFYIAMAVALPWPFRIPEDRRSTLRIAVLFGVGLAIPLGANALYDLARWGTPIDIGYNLIPGVLQEPNYQYGILSVNYIPRQLYAILFRSWNFVDQPPFLQPSWYGLSLFLTTPLFLWLFRARSSDPRVVYAIVGVALGLIPILTHGTVGFSQFGYRFSLDVQPILFVVLATVFERGMSRLAVAASILAVATNLYGIWAIGIGFVAY